MTQSILNQKIFVQGDFNIDFLDKEDESTKKLNNLINQWGCERLIADITRDGLHKDSCIDQIITNSNVILANGVADIHLSGHQAAFIYVQRKPCKMPPKKVSFQGKS